MTDGARLKLWMLNQYAVGPNQAGGTRHAGLARGLALHGVDSLIIASPRSYMSGETPIDLKDAEAEEPQFMWLRAPSYSGNSVGRILNMLAFAVKATLVPLFIVARRRLDRPDVVMGSSPSLFAALAAWGLAKATGAKFILEIRDIYPKTIIALGHASRFHPFVVLLGCVERFLYRRAELVVSPLQRAGHHVNATVRAEKDWVWIPNYVDLARTPEPEEVRETAIPFRIVYTGTHGIANALDTVLIAADILRHRGVEFWFYGAGVAKSALRMQAEELKLTNAHFQDPVPKDQVVTVQQDADALLLVVRDSPLYEDGFSANKLYDYLAAGRPIIMASNAPDNPVAECAAGVTVAPENPQALADGIVDLMSKKPQERAEMGKRGRELVRRTYDLPIVARALAEALKGLFVEDGG